MDTDDGSKELMVARAKRDQALACAFLSFVIALALVASNVGPDRQTDDALVLVRQHKEILAQNQSALKNNLTELAQDQIALETVLRSRKPSQ